jgi:hypothetical protein
LEELVLVIPNDHDNIGLQRVVPLTELTESLLAELVLFLEYLHSQLGLEIRELLFGSRNERVEVYPWVTLVALRMLHPDLGARAELRTMRRCEPSDDHCH